MSWWHVAYASDAGTTGVALPLPAGFGRELALTSFAQRHATPQFAEEIEQERGVERAFGLLLGLARKERYRLPSGAVDQFYDKVVRAYIVDLADIRVIECRNGPRLAIESRSEGGFGNFYGNVATELCIARLPHQFRSSFNYK